MRKVIRHWRNFRHRIRDDRRLQRALQGSHRIILVHQMGKVGSSTVSRSLRRHTTRPVFQTHWINPKSLDSPAGVVDESGRRSNRYGDRDEFGRRIHARLVIPRHPADVITLVRDPIARNVSSYFQHLDEIWNVKQAHARIAMDDLLHGFHDVFEHDEPLEWFDQEIEANFGIDVFKHPFPAAGAHVIEEPPYRLLILRADLADREKIDHLQSFLGIADLPLIPANIGEQKAYAEAYRAFRNELVLTPAYVDRLLESKYAIHFFDAEQRAAFRVRWTTSDGTRQNQGTPSFQDA